MTLLAGTMKYRYEGNGSTAVFSYPTRVFDSSYLVIKLLVRTTSAEVETLAITTDYTVALNSLGTASITIVNAAKIPSVTQDILISQEIPLTQDSDFPSGTSFPSSTVETALDKLTALTQGLSEKVDRSIVVSENEVGSSLLLELPAAADRALKYVAFDGSGNVTATSGVGTTTPISLAMEPVVAAATTALALTALGGASAGDVADLAPLDSPAFTTGATIDGDDIATEPDVAKLVRATNGILYGLGLTYTAATTITVAAGFGADSTGAKNIDINTAFTGCTLQSSGAWASGSSANKLDTGARANSTCYHVFAIWSATDDNDILFSTNISVPTLPSGYTLFRRIGSIFTDGSGNIRPFFQDGDNFSFVTPVLDVSTSTLGATAAAFTVSTPLGVSCRVLFNAMSYSTTAGVLVIVSDPRTTDAAPSASASPGINAINPDNSAYHAQQIMTTTNTSSQVRARSNTASTTLNLVTVGYIDSRGRS